MSLFNITITSTNQKSLTKFLNLFIKITETTQLGLINRINHQKLKKKIITILKSPHVNKKAQEQFKINYFNCKFNLYFPKELRLALLFKKLQKNLFTDIKIKIKSINSKQTSKNQKQKVMNPLNITFENPLFYNFNAINAQKNFNVAIFVQKYIKSFEIGGETFLRLCSSVGRAKD